MTSDLEIHMLLVHRLVDDAINGENTSVLDEVCTERFAVELRDWFAPFRVGFPDWRQEIAELVAEGETVVPRCGVSGDKLGGMARGAGHRPVDGGGRSLVLHRP